MAMDLRRAGFIFAAALAICLLSLVGYQSVSEQHAANEMNFQEGKSAAEVDIPCQACPYENWQAKQYWMKGWIEGKAMSHASR